MPPIVVASIISAAAGTAGAVMASRSQAGAVKDAAKIDSDATMQALDDARKQRDWEQKFEEEKRDYSRQQDLLDRERQARLDTQSVGDTAYDRARYAEGTNYERNRYADFLQTLEPYREAGQTATQRLQMLMGGQPSPYTGPTYNQVAQTARTQIPTTSTVTLKAPTGETRQFAWSDPNLPVFIAKGAEVIGA